MSLFVARRRSIRAGGMVGKKRRWVGRIQPRRAAKVARKPLPPTTLEEWVDRTIEQISDWPSNALSQIIGAYARGTLATLS